MAVCGVLLDNGQWLQGKTLEAEYWSNGSQLIRYVDIPTFSYNRLGIRESASHAIKGPIPVYPAWNFSDRFNENGLVRPTGAGIVNLITLDDGLYVRAVFENNTNYILIQLHKDGSSFNYAVHTVATINSPFLAITGFVWENNYIAQNLLPKCGIILATPDGTDLNFGEWLLSLDNVYAGLRVLSSQYYWDTIPLNNAYLHFLAFDNSSFPVSKCTLDVSQAHTNDISKSIAMCRPSTFFYDGLPKEPQVLLELNGESLIEGRDYVVDSYSNNTEIGTGYANVSALSPYTGTKKAYFQIFASQGSSPYEELEPSGSGGGNMHIPAPSDTIGLPAVPSLSMSDCGFCRIYNPTKQELQQLAQYLWTDQTFMQSIVNHAKQLIENPMDAIICLNLLPCEIGDGGQEEFKVLFVPTGINMTKAANQFVSVDCGYAEVESVMDSALDFSPYTRVSLFLPYIGMVSLNPDEVVGHILHVNYRVDIVTGGCVALVSVGSDVMYQFSGHCAISMPLTGADYSNLAAAMIQTVKAAATIGAAGAGAAAAASVLDAIPDSKSGTLMESRYEAAIVSKEASFAGLTARNITNTVGAVMGAKPEIARTGTFSGNTGYLGVRRPYLIIERPRLCNPAEYGKYNGYPSMQTVQLKNVKGFTQIQQVQLTEISATNPELDEIQRLLKQGVIL